MTSEQGLPKSACNKTIVLAVPPSASHRTSEGNLAIALLASILRANGWDVTLFDAWLLDWSAYKLATEIAKVPNLLWVGFSCYKTNLIGAAATINHLKGLGVGVPFLAGGYGPTFEPDAFLKAGFDIAAIGEGERTLLDLSNAIAEGDDLSAVPGIVYLDSAGTRFFTGSPRIMLDLEEAPLPSTDLMVHVIESKSALHVETSRGCRGGCTYCSIVAFGQKSGTPKWRQKSIGRIVEELVALSRIGASTIKVIDDSFIEPPRDATWARTLASAIRQHGLRVNLRVQIRADRVNDELIANLVDCGFYSFACGIENFSDMALRRMAKSARAEDNLRALDIFYKHGVLVQAGLILFDPNTTIQELRENLKWMLSYKWVVTKGVFSEMFAAEGTTFTRRLSTTGYVTQVMERTMNKSYDVLDERARTAYHALKYWQLSYGSIYDMTVDPLNAPKAIDIECRSKFHLLSIKLKERDLAFFSRVLDLVDANISLNELLSIAQETVHSSSSWISDFSEEVRSVYKDAQLPYNTQCNLFLASQQI